MTEPVLLSVDEMREAERRMYAQGAESYALMQRAGQAVAGYALAHYRGRKALVLAGPGNNGGDGFVAAQTLLAHGMDVSVAHLSGLGSLKGDAARAAGEYKGPSARLENVSIEHNPVIIDAVFGIGLSRPVEGATAKLFSAINEKRLDVIAVDIPSGVAGDSGAVLGTAIKAKTTITFACKKYGHLLMPGRILCGEVIVADIGIRENAIMSLSPRIMENTPLLWQEKLPWPQPQHHKYHRGHTLAVGGAMQHAGAAKLAAMAALRTGSGLASIVCENNDMPVYAASALSLITESLNDWEASLGDARKNTVLIGPGAGAGESTRRKTLAALAAGKRMVLDADALTSFAENPDTLFNAIHTSCILTPHAGEFARLFSAMDPNLSKLQRTLQAAASSHAVVIFKGYDTVIAAPDGSAAINANAPPDLATAGTGDVLSGICAGMLAQGMGAFDAACAAVWIHAEAARQQGAGLIAEDLIHHLPTILQKLKVTK